MNKILQKSITYLYQFPFFLSEILVIQRLKVIEEKPHQKMCVLNLRAHDGLATVDDDDVEFIYVGKHCTCLRILTSTTIHCYNISLS